jgi:uncharacterized protein
MLPLVHRQPSQPMPHATFDFQASLQTFLPRSQRGQIITHAFDWKASIKDMIESLGVPHPEIELLTVHGAAVDFEHIVQPDDPIICYPVDAALPPIPHLILRPPYPGRPAFVLDQHLGRLASYLRMMGFDTLYRNDYHDEELAQVSHDEGRILLTRDVGLLKRSRVIYGYFVRSTHREAQLLELTRRYDLVPLHDPFKHCMKCNGLLAPVATDAILDRLPDGTARYYQEFHQCADCQQVFWKGPHYQRMQALMQRVIAHVHDP